jgi:diguanylate cyclase (GGDEF)-like protein
LTALLIQQGLFALLWWVLGAVRIARQVSWHWAAGIMLISGGLGLVVLRDATPRWLGFWFSGVLLYAGFVLVWRGTQIFARQAPSNREQLLGWLLYAAVYAMVVAEGSGGAVVMVGSGPPGYLVWRAASTVQRGLREEFGASTALGCAAPFWLIGFVLLARGLAAPVLPQITGGSLHIHSSANLGVALAFVACGLMLNLGLVALVCSRMLRRLQRASEHDSLTGLLNRRGIQARLAQESHRLGRQGQPFSVLSIDVDHFKRINDRHGHPAGDAVLQALGQTLKQVGRDVDLPARAGGEEFWVLLPATHAEGARLVAERLIAAVRELRVPAPGGQIAFTVSIGIVTAERAQESLDTVMQRLDTALYRAKQAGRDRVEVAGPPTVRPGQPMPA